MNESNEQKVLLHICCGVCAFHCVDHLQSSGYGVTGLFYNPNITDHAEYVKRRQAAAIVGAVKGIEIKDGPYESRQWTDACGVYGDMPEGGQRCLACYKMRLDYVFNFSRLYSYDFFTTTLSISPHKNSSEILAIGQAISREKFLSLDFKKKDGFANTMRLAKEQGIYRQKYCGCSYSKG